jgi:hypothetical protein
MTARGPEPVIADGSAATLPGLGGKGLASVWLAVVLLPVVVAATAGAVGFW